MKDIFSTTTAKRVAAVTTLALATVFTTGCGSVPRGFGTAAGAVLGGVLGHEIGGKPGAAVGAVAGAGAGSLMEAECENKTNTRVTRSINGDQTSPWRGSQTRTSDCRDNGPQNNLELPKSVPQQNAKPKFQ